MNISFFINLLNIVNFQFFFFLQKTWNNIQCKPQTNNVYIHSLTGKTHPGNKRKGKGRRKDITRKLWLYLAISWIPFTKNGYYGQESKEQKIQGVHRAEVPTFRLTIHRR